MSDSLSGYDEDSLPWLQEVENEDARRGISARTMLAGLVIVLLVAAAVAAAFFWLGRRDFATAGTPELIRAPAGPYKVKPQDPGGLDIAGESQTTFETSAGQDVDSRLNLGAEGEQAEVQPKEAPKAAAQAESNAEPKAAEAPPPAPKPSGAAGAVIQLGAYKNVAQAERAWTALSARFSVLSGLSKTIVPYSAGGSTGYRLRAAASSPDTAHAACQTIQAGGESCFIAH